MNTKISTSYVIIKQNERLKWLTVVGALDLGRFQKLYPESKKIAEINSKIITRKSLIKTSRQIVHA